MRPEPDVPSDTHLRLDVWLWRARFFKMRGMASDFVSAKGVRLARGALPVRKINKPSYEIKTGDILAFTTHGHTHHLEIRALGQRRGPAEEAAGLYVVVS
jgi:ribosome-associated heat shock protein Hsp15